MISPEIVADKRELILAGAEKVFARSGYSTARVEDIAEEAGVAKGTIYLYFPSKQEVAVSLIEERANDFVVLMQKQLQGLDQAHQVLAVIVQTHVDFYLLHMGLLDVLFQSLPQLSPDLQVRLCQGQAKVRNMIIQSIQGFVAADCPVSLGSIEAIISGSTSSLIINKLHSDQPIVPQEIVDDVVTIVGPGLFRE